MFLFVHGSELIVVDGLGSSDEIKTRSIMAPQFFSATAWDTTRSGDVSRRMTVLSCDRVCDLLCVLNWNSSYSF